MLFGVRAYLVAGLGLQESQQSVPTDTLASDTLGAVSVFDLENLLPPLPTGRMLVFLIAGGIVCLGIGLWIARPSTGQIRDDAEAVMFAGTGRRRRVKRAFTPMAWLQRNPKVGSSRSKLKLDNRRR